MLGRFLYFAEKAAASVRESPGISLLTAGTIGAALLVLGAYVVALQNLEGLALVWGRSATVTAYVADEQPRTGWESLRQRLEAFDAVQRAELVTPLEALERFRARGPEAAALVAGVSEDVLPASIELHLEGGFLDLVMVEGIAHEVGTVSGIDGVDYGREEFDRLQALLDLLRYGGFAAGLLIALATAFITSNTIRLTVYARREEIAILQLVGATSGFIRTPFLIEGAIWGLAGGVFGVGALYAADALLASRISVAVSDVVGGLNVHLFAADIGMGMLGLGMTLGVVGSALAVRRFLDLETA